jgi:hypothetical protein
MTDLLKLAIAAHGGLDRWNALRSADVHFLIDGVTWTIKDVKCILNNFHHRFDLHQQQGTIPDFETPNQLATFRADRVAIERPDHTVVEELLNPAASFKGQQLETHWTKLQLIYFVCFATWTYMTTPFCFTMPGFATKEIDPWQEGKEAWRRLKVTFPDYLAKHSREQTYYFNSDGLLKRHDYVSEPITTERTATHYIGDYQEFDGIMIGTRQRVYILNPDGTHAREPLLVSLDVEEVAFR